MICLHTEEQRVTLSYKQHAHFKKKILQVIGVAMHFSCHILILEAASKK
jgi:hypothetical protein